MSNIHKRIAEEQDAFEETQDLFEAAIHFARIWLLHFITLDELADNDFEEQVEEMRKRFGK